MPREIITTPEAPSSPLFSQAVKAGPFVYVSGTTGALGGIPEDFAGLNDEYGRWFPTDPPTRYVAKLGVDVPGLLVSIRMTAYTG